ncbi:MAG: hypothetical protein ACRCU1_14895, partial [Alsobacter sp.]
GGALPAPTYAIALAPTSVAEGDTGPGNVLTYTISRTGDVSAAGSVALALTGTADASDYAVTGLVCEIACNVAPVRGAYRVEG